MNILSKTFLTIFSILLLAALNIGASYILPYPYSKINIIFIALLIIMMWSDSGTVIWISFFSHFFIELFSTTPYGIILFSSTIAWLFCFWLYKNFFTNRSWYSATALMFFVLICYHLFYAIILLVTQIFGLTGDISWSSLFVTAGWEILFSVILMSIIYFILSIFIKKLSATTIEHGLFKV